MVPDRILGTIAELTNIIDRAGLGLAPWSDLTTALAATVAGATSVFMRHDRQPNYDAFAQCGFSPELLNAYSEHYGAINPWTQFWKTARYGIPYCSSKTMPAASLFGTEFYNDWLAKLEHRSDGIGIQIDGSRLFSISLMMQLPDRGLDEAEAFLSPILGGLANPLKRAADLSRIRAEVFDHAMAGAALVDRAHDAGLVIDGSLRIVDANAQAVDRLSRGIGLRAVHDRIVLQDAAMQAWLQASAFRLSLGQMIGRHRQPIRLGEEAYSLSIFRLPEDETVARHFLFHHALVLVLIRPIGRNSDPLDPVLLKTLYGLTPSEIRLAAALLTGQSLNEAGDRLGITRETARHRLKQVFAKTATGRQSQLISLLLSMQ